VAPDCSVLAVFINEAPTLRHLLDQKLDGLSILNEQKDVAHCSCKANEPVIVILLVYEHLSSNKPWHMW
jgi:hypothetical protein